MLQWRNLPRSRRASPTAVCRTTPPMKYSTAQPMMGKRLELRVLASTIVCLLVLVLVAQFGLRVEAPSVAAAPIWPLAHYRVPVETAQFPSHFGFCVAVTIQAWLARSARF